MGLTNFQNCWDNKANPTSYDLKDYERNQIKGDFYNEDYK